MGRVDDLSMFRGPNVAVDIAVLTVVPAPLSGTGLSQLAVLVEQPDFVADGTVLPGRFLREGQTVAQAVADALHVKAGLVGLDVLPRLLRVFDDPGRDPRGWTLSLGHAVSVAFEHLEGARGQLAHVDGQGAADAGSPLLFDHDVIVREAAEGMRARYELEPDPDGLFGVGFTLAELRDLHEGVLGQQLRKDTFNRRMVEQLRPQTRSDGTPVLRTRGGRPAQVYLRQPRPGVPPASRRRLVLPRETN
ncbi:NUDIX hydrolase [Knoellia sp. CPCC 206435]|uniref:NUDIX hydrolase n=1 Tax=Knoellia terrae TaxID=3404797 RepID=UPI003B42CAB7